MINAPEVAKQFHEVYERLAPSFGYATRTDTKVFDPESPNGKLMIAVISEVCTKIQQEAFHAGFQTGLKERG